MWAKRAVETRETSLSAKIIDAFARRVSGGAPKLVMCVQVSTHKKRKVERGGRVQPIKNEGERTRVSSAVVHHSDESGASGEISTKEKNIWTGKFKGGNTLL